MRLRNVSIRITLVCLGATLLASTFGWTPTRASAQARTGFFVAEMDGRADVERAVAARISPNVTAEAVRGAWAFVAPTPTAEMTDALAGALRARLRLTTLFVVQTRSAGGQFAVAVHSYGAAPTPHSEFATVPYSGVAGTAARLAAEIGASGPAAATPTSTTPSAAAAPTTANLTPAPATRVTRTSFGFRVGANSTLVGAQVNAPLARVRAAVLRCGTNVPNGYSVQVSLRVGADGAVASFSTRARSGPANQHVDACVVGHTRSMRFPAAAGTSEVNLRVSYAATAGATAAATTAAATTAPVTPTARPATTPAPRAATSPPPPSAPARITVANQQYERRWVFIDGRLAGTIDGRQSRTFEVTAGSHQIVCAASENASDHPLRRTMNVPAGNHHQWRLSGSAPVQMQRHDPVMYPDR